MRGSKELAVGLAWFALVWGSGCAWFGSGGVPDAAPDSLAERLEELGDTDPGRPSRVLWISLSGLEAGAPTRELSWVGRLAAHGASADRLLVSAPSAVQPAHATLVTGRSPADHGVIADHPLGQRGVRPEASVHASQLTGPALWQETQQRGLAVAALDWPGTTGADLPDLLPDALPLRKGERWPALIAEGATPWLVERAETAPVAAWLPGRQRDAFLVSAACELLQRERPPALLMVRLSQAPLTLAISGPATAPARAALERADAEVGRLLACADAGGALAGAAVIVTGDIAWFPVHTAVRPNAVLLETGLIEQDRNGVVAWSSLSRSNGASAFVYAENERAAVTARSALAAAAEATGAFRIVGADEMIERGADPQAWFGLDARPGF
ncbi:MAG: alkaline phosphatase family protein, partial [Myxococcales bacterium]|nr:alkaline phosphatase family protein [Myxococcales bacterium]